MRPPVLGLLLLAACSGAPGSLRPAALPRGFSPLPRCFELSFGPWTVGTEDLRRHSPLPRRIGFTAEQTASEGPTHEYWAVRWPGTDELQVGTWRMAGTDSIALRLPSWWNTGLSVTLAARTDTLRGRAEVYAEKAPATPTFALVTAIPTECPDSLPHPWR